MAPGKYLDSKQSLEAQNPALAREWHPTLNGGIAPSNVRSTTPTKAWWICPIGHSYESQIRHRNNGSGCPYCAGQKVLAGFNDLATTNPGLISEWHPSKNQLTPAEVQAGSSKKAWWVCQFGHSWLASVSSRAKGSGCGVCANVVIQPGVNDLQTTNPALSREWGKKNGSLLPTQVVSGSRRSVWWQCKNGHEWEAAIVERTGGASCPFCSNQKVKPGFNDLVTKYPLVAKEWHPGKNSKSANQVIAGSASKAWWLCSKGHEWQGSVVNRTRRGSKCPVCANKKVQTGFNDLVSFDSDLASEWDVTKNNGVAPASVLSGSHAMAWWQCVNKHSWRASISSRSRGSGCPVCANLQVQEGANDLATTHPGLAEEWNVVRNGDLSPSQVIAGTNKKLWWVCQFGHEYESAGSKRITGQACPVCSNHKVQIGFNDLASQYPEIAKSWEPELNGGSKPTQVTAGSSRKFWWACKHGHKFQATPAARLHGIGCPVCAGKKVLEGINDLATTHPMLLAEWNYSRNVELKPTDVMAGTSKRIWWQCNLGHEWQTSGNKRVSGQGCPSCATFGFNQAKAGIFYFIENRDFGAKKVGITNVSSSRLAMFQSKNWQIIKTYEFDEGIIARKIEVAVLRWLRKELNLPIFLGVEETGSGGGWSETFSGEAVSDEAVIARINLEIANLKHVLKS